ncbi:MAG: ATP-binding protein, partial [Muribaculaceae bacterium]|nr:ATP-binding protein [Muribaculaceae bacterium]
PDLMVYTDEALLSQVILNIVKNAAEANPAAIAIEAGVKADESVEIRISNDGELIPDDLAGQIFTPFFTTRPSGNGIGLSLSRRIVSHLGGTLTLATRPRTCFAVRL